MIDAEKFPNLIYYLKCFLDYTVDLFNYVSPVFTTQSNESLNSTKTKYACKNTYWKSSFHVRMAINVLHKNNPYKYYFNLIKEMSLTDLNEESNLIINKYATMSSIKKAKYSDISYVSKRNKRRYERRHKKYPSSKADHITRIKEINSTEEQINKILKSFKPIKININKTKLKKKKNTNQKPKPKKTNRKVRRCYKYESEESNSNYSIEYDESDDNDQTGSFLNIPAALNNCGNTCYINAALQALFQLPIIEEFFDHPKDNCSELAQSLKNLYFEVKFSDIVCNPIVFICNYREYFEADRIDSENEEDALGDAMECLGNLILILESNFEIDVSLYKCQIKQQVTCNNDHSFVEEKECELFIEIYLFNNNCETIEESVNELFTEETDNIYCPNDLSIMPCKYYFFIDPMPMILFIHINRYYYSEESQTVERIPFTIEINDEININSITYRFKGAILHYGNRFSGHYKVINRYNDFFYIYSDSFIEKIDDFDFSDYSENYDILIYQKID